MADGLGFGRRRLIQNIVTSNWEVEKPEFKKFSYNELLFVIQEIFTEEGKQYFTKATSKMGFNIFKAFVSHLLYRNVANYDSMILITSEKGTGKSSAAIMMARQWCRMLGIQFNPARHIAYNNADVLNKIELLRKFEPLICVSGSSKIYIKQNNIIQTKKIKELVNMKNYEVLSYNQKNDKFEYQKPTIGTVYNKKETIYEIELENGIKLFLTKDHKVLTKNRGYVKVKNLCDNDEVVVNSKKCIVCNKEFFPHSHRIECCSSKCSNIFLIKKRKFKLEHIRDIGRKYHKEKIQNDIYYRLKHNLMTRIHPYIKNFKGNKDKLRFDRIIGCSKEEFKEHLEKQFMKGMNWNNYGIGTGKWNIDHIKPLCEFNLDDRYEQQKAVHYTNTQPLWWIENNGQKKIERFCVICNKKFIARVSKAKFCSEKCRYQNRKRINNELEK